MERNMFIVKVLVEAESERYRQLETFLSSHHYPFNAMPVLPEDYIALRFSPPFRVGKKQKRAVLDSNGLEVVLFPRGAEQWAEIYCAALNREMQG